MFSTQIGSEAVVEEKFGSLDSFKYYCLEVSPSLSMLAVSLRGRVLLTGIGEVVYFLMK